MTAKEWLGRGWKLNREIDALERAKRRAYDRCISATVQADGQPTGKGGQASDGGMSRYAAFAAMVDQRIDRLISVKCETLAVIDQVEDSSLRTLLVHRYINFEHWEQIAVDMHYSYQHICRLHGQALQKIKDVIKCDRML